MIKIEVELLLLMIYQKERFLNELKSGLNINFLTFLKVVLKFYGRNKTNLSSERIITTEEGMNKAEDYHMYFYETSSKEDINIEKIIETVVK